MTPRSLSHLARRLMRHPAAPYHEHAVREEVEAICREHGLTFHRDPFGNVIEINSHGYEETRTFLADP